MLSGFRSAGVSRFRYRFSMRKLLAMVVALSIIGIAPINAAVKSGANCSKVKASVTVKGLKYTCIKSGKRLVWNKGVPVKAAVPAPSPSVVATPIPSSTPTVVATPTPTPTPTATPTPTPTPSQSSAPIVGYTMAQVKANNTAKSCWTAIDGFVYDLTNWISAHPGGSGAILFLCGTDGTNAFKAQHEYQARPAVRLDSYKLGPLNK